MPSPLGHALAGYIIRIGASSPGHAHQWKALLLYGVAASAPDLDLLPGILVGDPNKYHHGISHSIGLAVVFAILAAASVAIARRGNARRAFVIAGGLYLSHLGLDLLNADTTPPFGEPLFWPLTNRYFIAPFAILPDITRTSSSVVGFFTSLVSLHNLWTMTAEALVLTPLALLTALWRRRRNVARDLRNPPVER